MRLIVIHVLFYRTYDPFCYLSFEDDGDVTTQIGPYRYELITTTCMYQHTMHCTDT